MGIAAALVLLAGCGEYRPDPWTHAQVAEAVALIGAIGADAGTSAAIIRPGRCQETDAIIRAIWGAHPSAAQFALNAVVGIGLALGVAEFLPGRWRDAWLLGLTGVELYFAVYNSQLTCR